MIREATRKDIPAIAEMEKKYIEVAWTQDMLSECFESGSYSFFVDEEDDRVVAYGFIQWVIDEGDVCNIATDKEFRNKGKAGGILKIMEEKAKERKVTKLFLEVCETNAVAIALYAKAGFSEIYRRANYYGKHAAVVMEKNI